MVQGAPVASQGWLTSRKMVSPKTNSSSGMPMERLRPLTRRICDRPSRVASTGAQKNSRRRLTFLGEQQSEQEGNQLAAPTATTPLSSTCVLITALKSSWGVPSWEVECCMRGALWKDREAAVSLVALEPEKGYRAAGRPS